MINNNSDIGVLCEKRIEKSDQQPIMSNDSLARCTLLLIFLPTKKEENLLKRGFCTSSNLLKKEDACYLFGRLTSVWGKTCDSVLTAV
jgi:hypothetical protein